MNECKKRSLECVLYCVTDNGVQHALIKYAGEVLYSVYTQVIGQ